MHSHSQQNSHTRIEINKNRSSRNIILSLVKVHSYMNIDNPCAFSPAMVFIMLSLILTAKDNSSVFFLLRIKNVIDIWSFESLAVSICTTSLKFQKFHILRTKFDVSGSLHHSIFHIGNPTKCNSVSKFYFIFI
jgi:hypothetical protein